MTKGLIAAVLIIFAVIVTVGLLSTGTWNPSWNPFAPSVKTTIEKSLSKLSSVESFVLQGKVAISGEETQEGEALSLALLFETAIDRRAKEHKKSQSSFDANLLLEGVEFSLAGEVKTVGEEVYLRLTNLPVFLSLLSPEIETIKDQWVKFDKKSLEELSEGGGEPSVEPDKEKEQALKKELTDLLKGREIFKIKKELAEEEIDGVAARHYLTGLNKKEIKEIIPEAMRIFADYSEEISGTTTEENLNEFFQQFPQAFDEFWLKIGEIEVEFWLSKADEMPLKIKFTKEIDLAEFSDLKEGLSGKFNIAADLNFSDFGKIPAIEAPKEFKELKEIINLFSPVLPEISL